MLDTDGTGGRLRGVGGSADERAQRRRAASLARRARPLADPRPLHVLDADGAQLDRERDAELARLRAAWRRRRARLHADREQARRRPASGVGRAVNAGAGPRARGAGRPARQAGTPRRREWWRRQAREPASDPDGHDRLRRLRCTVCELRADEADDALPAARARPRPRPRLPGRSTRLLPRADAADRGAVVSATTQRGRTVATYRYTDEAGSLLYEVVRAEPKRFYQRVPDGRGGWGYKLGDIRRVLYRLPEVAVAVAADEPVWVAEGEKDVEALVTAGVCATCAAQGAGKWRLTDSAALAGARVTVVADDDLPGRAHAADVHDALAGMAASVTVVLPAEGKDAHDRLAAGRELNEFVPVSLAELRPVAQQLAEAPRLSAKLHAAAGYGPPTSANRAPAGNPRKRGLGAAAGQRPVIVVPGDLAAATAHAWDAVRGWTSATDPDRFLGRYRDSDGRQRRESAGPRLRDAEALLAQRKAAMSLGQRVAPRPSLTVRAAAEAWYESTGHLRDTTRAAYRASLDVHVLPAFGRARLAAVTADDVARWATRARTLDYRVACDKRCYPDGDDTPLRRRPSAPYRARTVNLALTTLERVYKHAARRQGFAGGSPVAALERAERPADEPKAKVILTPAQLAAVLEHADPAYRPALAFLAGTGCRIGEALGLTWGDVDLAARTARIAAQLDRGGCRVAPKTGHARRTLDLPGALVAILREHKLASAHTAEHALVFVNGRGGGLDHRNVARRGLVAACKRAGLPVVSPHALRHAHASALLADGWDLPAVSRRLGHGSVAITASTYAHLLDDEQRRAQRRDRLDATYGPDAGDEGSTGAVADRGPARTVPGRAETPAAAEVAHLQVVRARAAS